MYPDEISLEASIGGDEEDSLSVHNRLTFASDECPIESTPIKSFSSKCFLNIVNCHKTSVIVCEGPRGSGKSWGGIRAIIQNLVRNLGESLINSNPFVETPYEEIVTGAYIDKYCSLLTICSSSDLAAASLYHSIFLQCKSTRLFGNLIYDRKSAEETVRNPANIVVSTIKGLREILYICPDIFSRVSYIYIHDAYKFVPVWSNIHTISNIIIGQIRNPFPYNIDYNDDIFTTLKNSCGSTLKQIVVSSIRNSRHSTEAVAHFFTSLVGFSPEIQIIRTPEPNYRHYYTLYFRSSNRSRFLYQTVYNILRRKYYKQVFSNTYKKSARKAIEFGRF